MEETFPHLTIQREAPVNEKRPGTYKPPKAPSDVRGHGRGLLQKLANAKEQSAGDVGGFDDRKLFRFTVHKGFNPEDLRKISTEIGFVSQEDETVVIGFASNAAAAQAEAEFKSLVKVRGPAPRLPGVVGKVQRTPATGQRRARASSVRSRSIW